MTWTFVVCDRAGNPLGELRQATGRQLRFPLNRIPSFGFTIDVDHPRAGDLTLGDKTLVKAYDDSTGTRVLRFLGPVVAVEKSRNSAGGSIAVTAAGVAWRLAHRLIGKNTAGATFGTNPNINDGTWLDRGEIAARIVEALNSAENTNIYTDAGDTGIRRGTITASVQANAGPWRYKPADEAISELSAALDGFDWEVAPVEPTADTVALLGGENYAGLRLGDLNCAPAIGGSKPDVVWEFGAGRRNVESWRDLYDSSALCNLGVNLPPGYPDNAIQSPIVVRDDPSINDRGLHEAVIPGDLLVDELRTKLTQEHVRIRKTPRRIIEFTPTAEDGDVDGLPRRVPRLWDDYIIGDVMPFHATELFRVYDSAGNITGTREVKTVDALFRAFSVTLAIDDNDVARPTLTFVAE